jgi:hypothetical protein
MQSCATILSGSKSKVKISGTPEKAKVYIDGQFKGITPTRVKIPRRKNIQTKIEIKAENYKPAEMKISSKISIGYVFLDVITGLVPFAIDFATGSIYTPYPRKIYYDLEPLNSLAKFNVGDKVLIMATKYEYIKGEITKIEGNKAIVKFTKPATSVEKLTKKTDKITEQKKFYLDELKKLKN